MVADDSRRASGAKLTRKVDFAGIQDGGAELIEGDADAHVVNALGRKLYVDIADPRGAALVSTGGDFNPRSLSAWRSLAQIRAWDVIVDVGANYGEMLLGIDEPGAALWAFEPNANVRNYLARSISESNSSVELSDAALGSTGRQQSDFIVDTTWSGRSRLATELDHPDAASGANVTQVVRMSTLDEELENVEWSSLCVKIDVEGGEGDVLAGASRTLGSSKPWAVMLEILHMDRYEIAELTNRHHFYLATTDSGCWFRIPPLTF